MDPERQMALGKAIGLFLLLTAFVIHIYEWNKGTWNLQNSLPLHLCAISGILSGLTFFWPNQRAFELLVFWGVPGAFHSLLTPEMAHGYTEFLFVEYYIAHGGIILSALYLSLITGRSLRPGSWRSAFVFTILLVIVIGFINSLLNTNYMYLCERPSANNPMLIGAWPWYLIILTAVALVHYYLVYLLFMKIKVWKRPEGQENFY